LLQTDHNPVNGDWGSALDVTSPSGEKLKVGWLYEMEAPASYWFLRLEPGEHYAASLHPDLQEIFTDDGVYHLAAIYYN